MNEAQEIIISVANKQNLQMWTDGNVIEFSDAGEAHEHLDVETALELLERGVLVKKFDHGRGWFWITVR